MEFTYRVAGPNDREHYIDFINYVFSHAYEPSDFKAMLPKEYRDGISGNAIHFLALDAQERIRAAVAVLPFTLQIGEHRLHCGFIGSVSVHPYARKEGHMKKLMSMADSWMKKKGIDLAILGGARQRYQYFGYTKGGLLLSYTVDSDNIRHGLGQLSTEHFKIKKITDAHDPYLSEIAALHQTISIRADRAADSFFDCLRSYHRDIYVLLEDETFAGYFTASDSSITELIVKNPAHYKTALKCWMEDTKSSEVTIQVCAWEHELIRLLDALAEKTSLSTAENYRVYHWTAVLPALLSLKRIASGALTDGSCTLCIDGQVIQLSCKHSEITAKLLSDLSTDELSRLESYTSFELQEKIFSPSALLRPIYLGKAPTDWFPIPLSIPIADQF